MKNNKKQFVLFAKTQEELISKVRICQIVINASIYRDVKYIDNKYYCTMICEDLAYLPFELICEVYRKDKKRGFEFRSAKLKIKICPQCQKEFATENKAKVYCTELCGQRFNRQKAKELKMSKNSEVLCKKEI